MMARVMKYATNGLQGNKEKTPPTSKNHFKRIISLLYILYCGNFVNWTKSSVIAVKAISKLDPFNNVTQFINGHFREHYHDLLYSFNEGAHNGKPTEHGNDATVLLTSKQKQIKTKANILPNIFAAHFKMEENVRKSSFNGYSPSRTVEIKLCSTAAINKLKHLIKWKIRKKLYKCTTSINKIKRSVNNNAVLTNNSTLMTTKYDTASIMTTKSSNQTAYNSRHSTEIPTTTPLTPNDIIPINSITQIESSNRPIKSQQQSLHRSRETNVFEMATKLKYNKLAKSKVIPDESKKGKISLLGLFELSTRYGLRTEGQSELAAAQMAVRHINNKQILNGYKIELFVNDTKYKSEHVKDMDLAAFYLFDQFDIFEHYQVDHYLSEYGLSVVPKYRRRGIALKLLEARKQLCKACGIKLTSTIFSSTESQRLAEKAGFEKNFEISYKELAEKRSNYTFDVQNKLSTLSLYSMRT